MHHPGDIPYAQIVARLNAAARELAGCRRALQRLAPAKRVEGVPGALRELAAAIAGPMHLPPDMLFSPVRRQAVVEARFLLWHYAVTAHGWSANGVATAMGFDHCTVLHGLKRVREWRETDKRFRALMEQIEAGQAGGDPHHD